MQIRPYEANDVEDVIHLSLLAWAPVFVSIEQAMSPEIFGELHPDWRIGQRNAVAAICADKDMQVWVAQVDDVMTGFVAVKLHPSRIGEITMLAVHPDYQRRGIATALMDFVLEWMQAAGVSVAMVETGGDPGHAPARHAYEKSGFQLLAIARYFKKLPDRDAIVAGGLESGTLTDSNKTRAKEPQEKRDMTADSVVEILNCVAAAAIELWIDGGWGVDALLGQQTRSHADLDLIIRSCDLPRFDEALRTLDFTRQPGGTSTNFVLVDPLGRAVDVHAITFDVPGYGLFLLPDGRTWPFPSEAFLGQGQIGGTNVRCLSAEAQVQAHGQGYDPTNIDLRDMQLLQSRFGVILPLALCQQVC